MLTPATTRKDSSQKAAELFVTNGFTELSIVNNGQLLGVVTGADAAGLAWIMLEKHLRAIRSWGQANWPTSSPARHVATVLAGAVSVWSRFG